MTENRRYVYRFREIFGVLLAEKYREKGLHSYFNKMKVENNTVGTVTKAALLYEEALRVFLNRAPSTYPLLEIPMSAIQYRKCSTTKAMADWLTNNEEPVNMADNGLLMYGAASSYVPAFKLLMDCGLFKIRKTNMLLVQYPVDGKMLNPCKAHSVIMKAYKETRAPRKIDFHPAIVQVFKYASELRVDFNEDDTIAWQTVLDGLTAVKFDPKTPPGKYTKAGEKFIEAVSTFWRVFDILAEKYELPDIEFPVDRGFSRVKTDEAEPEPIDPPAIDEPAEEPVQEPAVPTPDKEPEPDPEPEPLPEPLPELPDVEPVIPVEPVEPVTPITTPEPKMNPDIPEDTLAIPSAWHFVVGPKIEPPPEVPKEIDITEEEFKALDDPFAQCEINAAREKFGLERY